MAVMQAQDGLTLLQKACRNLAGPCGVRANARLLLGVSGGADSVALLRLLVEAAPLLRHQLLVAHFDHRLRPSAPDDAEFVRSLGAQLGLEVQVGVWGEPRAGEAAAREARHEFLQRTASRFACDAIVLGHQLDDQIETALMRLGRGSGLRGLGGMHWRRAAPVPFIRPLLDCPHEELVAYLHSLGQPWREDASNQDLSRTRNRVRHQVLPALDAAFGVGWRGRWSASLEDHRALWSVLRSKAESVLEGARSTPPQDSIPTPADQAARNSTRPPVRAAPTIEDTGSLDLAPLRRLEEPLLRVLLQLWLDPAGQLGLRRTHLSLASEFVHSGRNGQELDLPGPLALHIEGTKVIQSAAAIVRSAPGARLHRLLATKTSEPPVFSFHAHAMAAYEALRELPIPEAGALPPDTFPSTTVTVVCADKTTAPLVLRTGGRGEKVRLLGAPGSRRLTRILQDRRIPARLRPGWPVVADSSGIVWIPGVGIAERCRLDGKSRSAMRLVLYLAEVREET